MKIFGKVIVGALLLVSAAWATQKAVEKRFAFVDETSGFSFDVPRFPGADPKKSGLRVSLVGPVEEGGSNITVMVQSVVTTPDAWFKKGLAELKQLGLKVNSHRKLKVSGREAFEMDYQGVINDRPAGRILTLAVFEADRVVLLNCAAKPDKFLAVEPEFRACLDSFRLK